MYFYNFLYLTFKLEFFYVLRIKLFLTFASNINSFIACSPSLSKATYTNLIAITAFISKHVKSNRYALFKRSFKQQQVIYACNQAKRSQTKAKNLNIYKSKQQERSYNKKCDCQIKIALKLDQII
jgi:hypothetical protein